MKRFQECNKIEKIWRYRWYLTMPFIFIYRYIKGLKVYETIHKNNRVIDTGNYHIPNAKTIWKIILGEIHFKMKWYYTDKEVRQMFKNKFKK